jgi:hypothetical protein
MINYHSFVYLRYVLLVNVVAALIPTMSVKGRANDPLLHSTWWKVDQHSAVLVVVLAAIVGSALVFLATRRNIRTWWILVGCGIVSGDFPATFYLVTAPDGANVPLGDMYFSGTFCGAIAGVVLFALLRNQKTTAAA